MSDWLTYKAMIGLESNKSRLLKDSRDSESNQTDNDNNNNVTSQWILIVHSLCNTCTIFRINWYKQYLCEYQRIVDIAGEDACRK